MADHEVQRSEIVIIQLAREMMGSIDMAFRTTCKHARLVKAMMKFLEAIVENFFNRNVPERLKRLTWDNAYQCDVLSRRASEC